MPFSVFSFFASIFTYFLLGEGVFFCLQIFWFFVLIIFESLIKSALSVKRRMKEDNLCERTLTHVNLEESCSLELTGLNSSVSSLNCENGKDLKCHCFNDNCKKWTNEEHNRYLDYLEMSFVKQLHNSMGLRACYRGQSNSVASQKELVDLDRSSEQFTVLQDDQYLNINSEKDQSHSHTGADSVDAFKVPQTQSLKQKIKNTASAEFQECRELFGGEEHLKGKRIRGPASSSEQKHLSYLHGQDSIDSINEGTGQNFVDEDLKENTSVTSCSKRLKTAGGDTSNKDQIVPCSMTEEVSCK